MNIFKVKVGDKIWHSLNEDNFANETGKVPPHYQEDEAGKVRHYAVCPACENPIRIIGLIKRSMRESSLPFGRHEPRSISDLAVYQQERYDNCPLAVKNHVSTEDKTLKKARYDDLSRDILITLRDNFDRVCLVLQKAIDIKITSNLARDMLDTYFANDGYMFKYASLCNIPWVMAYMSDAQSLVYRIVYDGKLRNAISKHVEHVFFDNNKLTVETGHFVKINMYFSRYRIVPKGNGVQESITLVVTHNERTGLVNIFTHDIVFDYDAFQRYLTIPDGKGIRNQEILDVANDVFHKRGIEP